MFRSLIAAGLSLALALPAAVAPALADQRSYAHRHGTNGPLHLPPANSGPAASGNGAGAAIAVLGGLALAAALANRAREREEAADRNRHLQTRPHGDIRGHSRQHPPQRGQGRRAALVLPERCFRTGDGPRGQWRGWGARCLERSVPRPRLLPAGCRTAVSTWRGNRAVYDGRCLSRAGWIRTARR